MMLTGENVKYRKGLISGNTAISQEYSGVAFAGRQYAECGVIIFSFHSSN